MIELELSYLVPGLISICNVVCEEHDHHEMVISDLSSLNGNTFARMKVDSLTQHQDPHPLPRLWSFYAYVAGKA